MNQSDRTELVLVGITALVAVVFGAAIGVGDHLDAGRFAAALTPDASVLFRSDVVATAVLVGLFVGLAVTAKIVFGR